MSFPMVPAFQISAGTNDPYPGTFCLPQVPLPADVTVKVGDHATIQVIETTIHGGALYNVSLLVDHLSTQFRTWRPGDRNIPKDEKLTKL